MAVEQPAYTGAQYDSEFYQKQGESLFDYMRRLAAMRSQGVLGGGGMLDATPAKQPSIVNQVMSGVPLGQVQLNTSSSDSDFSMPVDRRTAAEKVRDDMAIQSGAKSDWLGAGLSFLGGPLGSAANWALDSARTGRLEDVLQEKAISQEEIDRALNDPAYNKALLESYNKGGFAFDAGDIPSGDLIIDPSQAGTSFTYGIDNIGNTIKGLFGMAQKPTDPFLTTVIPAGQYSGFNFGLSSPMEQAVAMQQAQAELAARQAALGTQMQADMGMLSSSSPSDSVSAGRTSSSDISYSSARDRSSTTGYDFNKD